MGLGRGGRGGRSLWRNSGSSSCFSGRFLAKGSQNGRFSLLVEWADFGPFSLVPEDLRLGVVGDPAFLSWPDFFAKEVPAFGFDVDFRPGVRFSIF